MTTSVILLLHLNLKPVFSLFWKDSDIKNKAFAYETITVTNLTVLTDYKMKPTITKYWSKNGKTNEASIKFNNTEIVTDKMVMLVLNGMTVFKTTLI
jgi:hypothetical protein